MLDTNKFIGQLSLLYFAILGVIHFLILLTPLVIFTFLALIFPKFINGSYFFLLLGIKSYIRLSPVKFKEKNLVSLLSSSKKFMIVSNHRSHLDMFIFLANVYKLRAVANAKIFKVPVLGQVMKMTKQFPLERGNVETFTRTMKDIQKAFIDGHVVLFFPEMTRSFPDEKGIKKFRLTAFQLARENNIEIIPVVLSGTDLIWPKGKSEMHFSHEMSIHALAPVRPNDFSSSADLCSHVHKLMENKLLELTYDR